MSPALALQQCSNGALACKLLLLHCSLHSAARLLSAGEEQCYAAAAMKDTAFERDTFQYSDAQPSDDVATKTKLANDTH